jgi:hypothetical protein
VSRTAVPGRTLLCLFVLAVLAADTGCGKKGPPQPPQRIRPSPPRALQVRQRGGTVWLSLRAPSARTDEEPFREAVVLRILRLPAGALKAPQGARPRPDREPRISRAGAISWVIPRDEWPSYRVGDRLEIPISVDSLGVEPGDGEGAPAGRQVVFVAEVQEGRRKRSTLAGPVHLTLCRAPEAPAGLSAEMTAPGIRLRWRAPEEAETRAHVYRSAGDEPVGDKPWKQVPAGEGGLLDRALLMGTLYSYKVRFAAGDGGSICESTAAEASVLAVDTFPPAPPEGLAAAAERTLIRLFWTPSPEADLAGYLIYRREGDQGEFVKITPQPIMESTYADTSAAGGARYSYVVTAVDSASPPNESDRSEAASERIP